MERTGALPRAVSVRPSILRLRDRSGGLDRFCDEKSQPSESADSSNCELKHDTILRNKTASSAIVTKGVIRLSRFSGGLLARLERRDDSARCADRLITECRNAYSAGCASSDAFKTWFLKVLKA